VVGCAYAAKAGCNDRDKLLALAADAVEYLLWAQEQGGRGLFPFPARRRGRADAFGAAERLMRRAEQQGRLGEVIRRGWIVDDWGEGGLQFDNGLCGVAVLELYRVTKETKYLEAAQAAADWAEQQPVVPNWNYNSFSIYLLAELARETDDDALRAAAVRKAQLGLYPGQLQAGPLKGRWFDPHNARLVYHYIMLRSLVSLAAALEPKTPEHDAAVHALRLGLEAHNGQFATQGVGNADTAFETLLMLKELFPESTQSIGNAQQEEAFKALESYCVTRFRQGKAPLKPGVWGRYLNFLAMRAEKKDE
jgi:hypothetical protein